MTGEAIQGFLGFDTFYRRPNMHINRQGFLALACACALGLGTAATAQPAAYPDRPVQLLVGYPPGGASDIVARLVAQELSRLNRQQFVVENKPGVGGMLAMSLVTKAAPDGYTLGLGVSGTLTTGPHLQKPPLYDPLRDFTSISGLAKAPMMLLANPASGPDSVRALISQAKAQPGQMPYATGAQAFDLAMRLFMSKAEVQMVAVPYPGGAAASMDVMGGRVPVMVDTIGAQQESVKAGKLRALAVLDSHRSPVFPDVPTMIEAGVAGYEAVGWTALVAPRGTPEAVVGKLNQQVRQILELPEIKQKLLTIGFEPWPIAAQELERTIGTEHAMWGKVVRDSGMAPQ
jgi:tripartite-type tricarboxylate transporter receptor subunit TctC